MKGRNWAFVMYPESMPDNWYEILEKTGLPFAISPLHDSDMDPTGEPKKPHYHVICQYDNTTTAKNVKENVCSLVNGTIPIKLESTRGMYRYHLHLDNPDKYQYDDRDRIFINGFDKSSVEALTATERDKMQNEILQFIEDNDITEYRDLLKFYNDSNLNNLLSVAKTSTILLTSYIKSKRHKEKELQVEKDKLRNELN